MEPPHTNPTLAAERTEMSDEERVARLEALWERLVDPDGLDRETLKNIEELTERGR
jgi:hypothetical protein